MYDKRLLKWLPATLALLYQAKPDVSISQKRCSETSREDAVYLVPVILALLAAMKELFPIFWMINIPSAFAQLDLVAAMDIRFY